MPFLLPNQQRQRNEATLNKLNFREKNEVNAKPVGQRFCPVTHARTHGRTSKKHNAVAGCGSKHGQQRQNNSSASPSHAILPSTLLQQKANWTNTV